MKVLVSNSSPLNVRDVSAAVRGRKHLTENSVWADQVDGWIATLEARYALPDEPAEAA